MNMLLFHAISHIMILHGFIGFNQEINVESFNNFLIKTYKIDIGKRLY